MIFAAAYIQETKWWDTPTKRITAMLFIAFSAGIQLLGLSGDPVKIIKTWLANPGPMFAGVQDIILLQFNIYLPQFSTPVLFWRWILANGPDLLIVRIIPSTPWSIPLYAFLLILSGISLKKLLQQNK